MKTVTRKQITATVDYELGDIVYLRVCGEKSPGMITAMVLSMGGGIIYQVTWDCGCTNHYGPELSNVYTPEWEEQGV